MASFIAVNSQFNAAAATSTNLATIALAKPKIEVNQQVQSINDLITAKATASGIDPSLARKIAYCESTDRQFDDSGKPLRGALNPADVGLFQINEAYHLKRSQSMGFDIYTTEGNINYAMWLLKNEGPEQWNYSKACWGK